MKVIKKHKTNIQEIKKNLGLDKYILLNKTTNQKVEEFINKYSWMIFRQG